MNMDRNLAIKIRHSFHSPQNSKFHHQELLGTLLPKFWAS